MGASVRPEPQVVNPFRKRRPDREDPFNLVVDGRDTRTGQPVAESAGPENPFRKRRLQSQSIREVAGLHPLLRGIEEGRRAQETPGLRLRRQQFAEAEDRERRGRRERNLLPFDVLDQIGRAHV